MRDRQPVDAVERAELRQSWHELTRLGVRVLTARPLPRIGNTYVVLCRRGAARTSHLGETLPRAIRSAARWWAQA